MAKKPNASPPGEVELPWQVVCKHSDTGMQLKGFCSEATFREVYRALFGLPDVVLSDQPKG